MPPSLDFRAPLTNRGPRLSELVFERLAEAIVDGVLAPGELVRDQALAEQLGVSRMPIREALQRLERAGLVETAASRYTRVTVLTPERAVAGMEYGGLLYGSVVRLATVRMRAADRERALALLDALLAAETAEQCCATVDAFYRHAFAHVGNDVLQRRSDLTYMVARIARWLDDDHVVMRVQRYRQALRDAVAARDADAAERAVRRMHGIV
jgi:DNA-binding GntR family transcriptional regulator